jgi:FKBP-type peptidyl-prolyl cis-trans isomerase SlyD
MTISENKFVSLIYELRQDTVNGNHIETVTEENPLSFIFGLGQMLPEFEANIKGLKANDTFDFGIKADDAYGPVYDDARADVPKDIFMHDGQIDDKMLFVDNVLPMQDKDGNVFYGKILSIDDDNVKMDFNHPLAGVNLHFSGKLLEVREATHEELNPKHDHDHGHSCGCGN